MNTNRNKIAISVSSLAASGLLLLAVPTGTSEATFWKPPDVAPDTAANGTELAETCTPTLTVGHVPGRMEPVWVLRCPTPSDSIDKPIRRVDDRPPNLHCPGFRRGTCDWVTGLRAWWL